MARHRRRRPHSSRHRGRAEHSAGWFWWLRNGGWAVLDQALFAGSHFALNILLARWLPAEEYGAFAVGYAAFLLVASLHTAFLTEPMMVFGAGKDRAGFRRYLGILLYGHGGLILFAVPMLIAVGVALAQAGSGSISNAFLGLAAASPFMLLLWLLRRTFYTRSRPRWGAAGGALYLSVLVPLLYGCHRLRLLSSGSAFVIMGLAALLVSAWFLRILSPRWKDAGEDSAVPRVAADHWKYGRWAAGTGVLLWTRSQVYYPVLTVLLGLEAAAMLKALMNLVNPMIQSIRALASLLLPRMARHHAAGRFRELRHGLERAVIAFLGGAALYFFILLGAGPAVFDALYGGRYSVSITLVLIAGVQPFAAGLTGTLGGALRASRQTRYVFWSYAASAAVTLLVGVPLSWLAGVGGALAGLALSAFTTAAVELRFYRRLNRFAAAPNEPARV